MLSHPSSRALLAGATLVLCTGPVSAHQPHDPVDALAISPSFSTDHTVFVVTDEYSFDRSTDGGFTWARVTLGLNNQTPYTALAFSPEYESDGVVLVGTTGDGVYRSGDGGQTWQRASDGLGADGVSHLLVLPGFGVTPRVLAAGIDGGLFLEEGAGLSWRQVMGTSVQVTFFAFSPTFELDSMVLAGDDSGRLYASHDGGSTWVERTPALASSSLTAIAFSPAFAVDATVFVGFYGGGVHRSLDGGATFARIKTGTGLIARRITALAVSPSFASDSTVFACGANAAVFRSTNGGRSWRKRDDGIYYRPQGKLAHYRSLGVSDGFSTDGVVFLGAFEGLFRSDDRGEGWLELEASRPADEISGLALSPQHTGDGALWLSTYGGGAYRHDGVGAPWSIQNVGLARPYLYDVAVSPGFADDSTVFSLLYGFVARSTNGGAEWGLTEPDPGPRSFPSCIALSPVFPSDQTIFLGSRYKGLYRSTDGGSSYERVLAGAGYVTAVAVSPSFEDDGTAFAGTWSSGVYRTADRGDSWERVNVGLAGDGIILSLAISSDFVDDRTLFAGATTGLYRSVDGGDSWELVQLGPGVTGSPVFAIALSPDFAGDGSGLASVSGAGLFGTLDHGGTWDDLGTALAMEGHLLRHIRYSPGFGSDGTVYGASGPVLLRSSDRGTTWTAIPHPARYEATHDKIRNQGRWRAGRHEQLSCLDFIYSDHPGDRSTFDFVGTGVSWTGPRTPLQAIADVYLDGALVSTVDSYSPSEQPITTLFSTSGLPPGPHTISIEVTGGRHPDAEQGYVVVDAFDVER